MGYKTRTIELNLTAGGTVKASEFGNRIQLGQVSSANASVTVTVSGDDNVASGPFPLKLNDYVELPVGFSDISITFAAQPGVTCTLLVVDMDPAPAKFEYYQSSRGTIDAIVSTVNVAVDGGDVLSSRLTNVTSAAAVKLADANPKRRKITLYAPRIFASGFMHIGIDNTVSTVLGRIEGGMGIDLGYKGEIWARTSSSSLDVSIFEESSL